MVVEEEEEEGEGEGQQAVIRTIFKLVWINYVEEMMTKVLLHLVMTNLPPHYNDVWTLDLLTFIGHGIHVECILF